MRTLSPTKTSTPPSEFPLLEPRKAPLEVYETSSEHWFVRITLLLVVFLHTTHHVSFRAIALILFVMRKIFIATQLVPSDSKMPITLTTVMNHLELNDRFQIFPACDSCHRIFKTTISRDASCPDCDNALFLGVKSNMFQQLMGRLPPAPVPKLAVPLVPLSSLLVDFLNNAENESECVKYLDEEDPSDGSLRSIKHGRVSKEAKDPFGKPFFDKTSLTEPDEIRLGVTFGPRLVRSYSIKYNNLLTLSVGFRSSLRPFRGLIRRV